MLIIAQNSLMTSHFFYLTPVVVTKFFPLEKPFSVNYCHRYLDIFLLRPHIHTHTNHEATFQLVSELFLYLYQFYLSQRAEG